jgi:hypothetical protein
VCFTPRIVVTRAQDLDKLEMILTAHQYEAAQPGLLLEEFFTSTTGRFKTDTGCDMGRERETAFGGGGSVRQPLVGEGA